MSGEDGSLHVAWRSGKVFRKADSLINLARDAVDADVKKTSNALISWMPYNIFQIM